MKKIALAFGFLVAISFSLANANNEFNKANSELAIQINKYGVDAIKPNWLLIGKVCLDVSVAYISLVGLVIEDAMHPVVFLPYIPVSFLLHKYFKHRKNNRQEKTLKRITNAIKMEENLGTLDFCLEMINDLKTAMIMPKFFATPLHARTTMGEIKQKIEERKKQLA